LLLRLGLHRLIPETTAFRTLYTRGLTTNLVLTNASHRGAARFVITKNATQVLRAFTRFYLHGVEDRAVVVGERIVARKVLPISIALDHRLIDGIHLNEFIKTLEEIAAAGLDAGD
jgi:pyruvate/2-oxoglutarate dehydrogenase complex dihydrolipoamide acyltransferase (E2) component